MMALVVAMAGMMFPAISEGERERKERGGMISVREREEGKDAFKSGRVEDRGPLLLTLDLEPRLRLNTVGERTQVGGSRDEIESVVVVFVERKRSRRIGNDSSSQAFTAVVGGRKEESKVGELESSGPRQIDASIDCFVSSPLRKKRKTQNSPLPKQLDVLLQAQQLLILQPSTSSSGLSSSTRRSSSSSVLGLLRSRLGKLERVFEDAVVEERSRFDSTWNGPHVGHREESVDVGLEDL